MARHRIRTAIALLLLAMMLYLYHQYLPGKGLTGFSVAPQVSQPAIQPAAQPVAEASDLPIEVYFCQQDDCAGHLVNYLNKSSTIHCAFFELDLEPIIALLEQKHALVVLDDETYKPSYTFARKDKAHHLMHNKFCILDNETVWTGSMNPKHTDTERNNNNAIIIHSKALAQNYEDEFQELWKGTSGKGAKTIQTQIMLGNTLIENYFCPEDWCANRIMEALDASNTSISFMTFSFTHDQIGEVLIRKHDAGVIVKGIFEKSQNNSFTELPKLQQAGIPAIWDTNKYNMHHKVFVIDGQIVITGSFNPSKNADTDNDENVLIIHDPEIAQKYTDEFERLYSPAKLT